MKLTTKQALLDLTEAIKQLTMLQPYEICARMDIVELYQNAKAAIEQEPTED